MILPFDAALRLPLAELLATALLAGPIGVWALHRRALFAAEVLPHVMLPTAGLAALAGWTLTGGLAVGALLGALLLVLLGGVASGRDLDGAATTVLGAATGAGTILTLESSGVRGLERLLFGDPLAATAASTTVTWIAAAIALAALTLLHRSLLATTLGDGTARAAGVSPARVELVAIVVLAVAVAVTASAVGAVLAFALLVGPAAVATRTPSSVARQLAVAAAAGVVAVVAGLTISANVEVPAGATIALAAGAPALLALALPRGA